MHKFAPATLALTIGALTASCAMAQDQNQAHNHAHNHAAMDHSAHAMTATAGATAQATIINGQGANVGTVSLTQGTTGTLIKVEASGLTPGWHGIHLHATGQCEAPFTSAGSHIKHTADAVHGLLNPAGPDNGDLPNVYADATGKVMAEVFTTRARIADQGPGEWLFDADGSALVIHAKTDDHTSQPIGGAGDRVACAVLKAQ